jgi:Ca2+-binding EF-hand superfamily protein
MSKKSTGFVDPNSKLVAKIALDFNNDGVVDRNDFYKSILDKNGGIITRAELQSVERVFDTFDKDKDGVLDANEAYIAFKYLKK